MLCKFLCKICIIILIFFSDENISRIDVSARSVRNIIYSCTCMFNNCISDILYITFLCNFFCNISSFSCLISWLFLIKSIYSRLLRCVFKWLLMYIFFFSLFLANHFTFFIYNLECMISLIFFIIFVSLFLMFWNMFLTFILCIIIPNFSRRKIVVETMFLIQKSLNFNIFLLFLKIILKIINFLNFLIFTIFLRAVNVFLIFNSCVKTIISVILIFCIRFIFCFFFNLCHQFYFSAWFLFRRNVDLTQKKRWNRNRRLSDRYFRSNIFFNRVFRLLGHFFKFSDHLLQLRYLIFKTFIHCFYHIRAIVTRRVFYYIEKSYHYCSWYYFWQTLFFNL